MPSASPTNSSVLEKMGFAGYFLLVHEIVAWAKANGIMVGPGRGSVGGSLVAYLIGLTEVDPIRFDLLFERFINPDRIDLPDADLDFMSRRRHEVVAQIQRQFGAENVAGISNFTTLQAAGALRDVSRIHGLEPYEYACSKLMEKEHGVSLSLEESAAIVPEIDKFKGERPAIWTHATKLEGCMRGLGQHAAGIVIADRPVTERAVVETRNGGRVVNWDKKYVEEWGLIKIDVLGLNTLDMLALGKDYVKQQTGAEVDYMRDVDLTDRKVLAAFEAADTTGIFQYESAGMRKLLKELSLGGALTFEDLVAVTALFRPGPLDAGMCDDYVAIKQGARHPYYEHPNLEPALRATHGVIIYQEQVMQISRDVAGYTLAEADKLRKIMGKKLPEEMAEQEGKFVAGAIATSGMSEIQAKQLFDKIATFAGYGFNRSHAVEYAVISFWTMWLKVHHASAFFAASLSVQDKEERLTPLVMDAQTKGIKVMPPDINRSTTKIEIGPRGELYAPFQALLGLGERAAEAIVQMREKLAGGWFKEACALDPDEQKKLFPRVQVNATHRDRLEKVGAFWSLDTKGVDPLHEDRLRDRLAFLPGFTVAAVKASRKISSDRAIQLQILDVTKATRECGGCTLKGGIHPIPRLGKTPKFMAVFDCPTLDEERSGKMLEGDGAKFLKAALSDAGLSASEGYYTSLVKSPKRGKFLTNENINGCTKHLLRELEILKPPVILVLGGAAAKHFVPTMKGSLNDIAGATVFDPKLDASIVLGINPLQVIFDSGKAVLLQKACEAVANLVKND
jgi:DNA polymerase-3 subunit alpha